LVLAIEEDAGVDILHRCGSYAKCTTCRIEYLEGEPEKMTRAEVEVLESRDLLGQVRLCCQALCDHDMKVRVHPSGIIYLTHGKTPCIIHL
jgi:ferredoxin